MFGLTLFLLTDLLEADVCELDTSEGGALFPSHDVLESKARAASIFKRVWQFSTLLRISKAFIQKGVA